MFSRRHRTTTSIRGDPTDAAAQSSSVEKVRSQAGESRKQHGREEKAMRVMKDRFPTADDSDLHRFLRARKYDTDRAVAMYDSHLQWRLETLNWPNEDHRRMRRVLGEEGGGGRGRFYVLDERDSAGRPVVYFCFRRFSSDGDDGGDGDSDGDSSGPRDDVNEAIRAYLYMIEEMVIPKLDGGGDGKWTVLIDASGIRIPPLSFLRRANAIFADNYPERLHRTVVFPVPGFVKKVVEGMVLRLVDPETRAKFAIVDGSVSELEVRSAMSSWKSMGPDVAALVDGGQLKVES